MAGEEHTKRVVSASEVPARLRAKIEPKLESSHRFGRKSYILGLLSVNIVGFIVAVVVGVIFAFLSETLGHVMTILVFVLMFILDLFICVGRFHDMNRSGWWALFMLIPYVNVVPALALLLVPGTDGYNDYGPPEE
ncbi:MAG: DUF805 domain-containing protein [Selenomonadaceae bacterium]|nr:DUF805 domain-containing protein [Selenomonadaceae bacterium]